MENTEFTYEKAIKKIDEIGGKPIAVEAQWDGDTQGWFLCMFVIVKRGFLFFKEIETHYLGTISLGNDIRLFQGVVPPYPESKVAQEIGEKLIEEYNIEFFFPSPDNPDDDCPSWEEKDKAINCEDCNKLIIPTDSPYLPKEICYNCHLTRESNQRIIDEEPYGDGVNMYLYKNEEFQGLGYCSNFESFKIAPFIIEQVESSKTEEVGINIVTLTQSDVKKLVHDLESEIDKEILKYEEPEEEEYTCEFVEIDKIKYKEKEFDLMNRFNSHHDDLRSLISSFDTAKKAYLENYEYKIYFKNGITYRDDSILRFINYSGKGVSTFKQLYEKFGAIISNEEIDKTVQKLKTIGCLKLNGIEITQTGKNIL